MISLKKRLPSVATRARVQHSNVNNWILFFILSCPRVNDFFCHFIIYDLVKRLSLRFAAIFIVRLRILLHYALIILYCPGFTETNKPWLFAKVIPLVLLAGYLKVIRSS